MRILYFSTDNSRASGAFRVLAELAKGFQNDGHDVLVVLPYGGSGTKLLDEVGVKHKTIYQFSWIKHIRFELWDYISHYLFLPNNWIAEKRIKKLLKNFKPDVAIINTVYSYVGAKTCKNMQIPYLWCIKEVIWQHSGKTFYNLDYTKELFNNSSSIVAASKSVMEKYLDKFDNSKMKYIYEGVDVSKYLNKSKKIFTEKKIHFVNTGRINKSKGQYQIIEALNKSEGIDFDLTLVGRVSSSYKKKLIKSCNFKNNLTFTGQVKNVKPYLEKSDIFVNPSIGEAFGLSTLEAGLAGCFLIGADEMGTKEIIGQDNGYLFKSKDIDDLLKKINLAISNKELITKEIPNIQDRLVNKFSSLNNLHNFETELSKISIKD